MREKIHSYLGFAKKSRNLVSGYNSCLHAFKKGKVHLMIVTDDISEKTINKFKYIAESANVEFRIYGSQDAMEEYTGEPGRGVFAICEENLANAILKEIDDCRQSGKE